MHVCVDARLIAQSGIGTMLKSSLESIKHANFCKLTLLCHESDQKLLSSYSDDLILMKSSIYSAAEQLEYLKKIPKCDLFFSPHFNVPIGPIRAKKRLCCIHDVYHLAHFKTLSFSQKVYAKCVYNAAFLLSDSLITISEFSKNEILKWATIRPKNIKIISQNFNFVPEKPSNQTKNFILYVGNLKPHKNLVRLIKAYAKVAPKVSLYIVGKKEGLRTVDQKLFEETEKNPFLKQNVTFTGYVTDEELKKLYAEALFFAFPSTYEGFGIPPLEAMASGCPVMAARAASIPEVCGDAVEYVDPHSIDSIAEGIQKLLFDEKRREELIRKGNELVAQKRNQKNEVVDVIHACCSRT